MEQIQREIYNILIEDVGIDKVWAYTEQDNGALVVSFPFEKSGVLYIATASIFRNGKVFSLVFTKSKSNDTFKMLSFVNKLNIAHPTMSFSFFDCMLCVSMMSENPKDNLKLLYFVKFLAETLNIEVNAAVDIYDV